MALRFPSTFYNKTFKVPIFLKGYFFRNLHEVYTHSLRSIEHFDFGTIIKAFGVSKSIEYETCFTFESNKYHIYFVILNYSEGSESRALCYNIKDINNAMYIMVFK